MDKLFGFITFLSCILVLTPAAPLVFGFWAIMAFGAIALYIILIPIRIFFSGMESLSNSLDEFRFRRH